MDDTQYNVTRPQELDLKPSYQPGVTAGREWRYQLEVNPLSFSERQMQFSWRAPGISSVMSNNIFLEFDVDLRTGGGNYDFQSVKGPLVQLSKIQADTANYPQNAALTMGAGEVVRRAVVKCGFGDCDAVGQSLTGYQLTINGQVISQSRQNEYQRTLNMVWFSPALQQKRFSRCGGKPTAYDSICCSGESFAHNHANAPSSHVTAFTGDTGLQACMENLVECTVDVPNPAEFAGFAANSEDVKTIRVRWPVNGCGILSPLQRNDECAPSCPLRASCRALANCNIMTLNLLFEDLLPSLVRNYGTVKLGDAGATKANNARNAITVTLSKSKHCQLQIEYLRLPNYMEIPKNVRVTAYQIGCYDPQNKTLSATRVTVPAACLELSANPIDCIKCQGIDRLSSATSRQIAASWGKDAQSEYVVKWTGVQLPQLPTWLCFTMEKQKKLFNQSSLAARAVINYEGYAQGPPVHQLYDTRAALSQYLIRNSSRNASIQKFSLEIQAQAGSFKYSGTYPFLKERAELYRDISKHCNRDFPKEADWEKFESCIMLSVSDYANNLASDGTMFPVVINAEITFVNKAQAIFGQMGADAQAHGFTPLIDAIMGKPVMLAIHPRLAVTIAPGSCTVTQQNIPAATADYLLSGEKGPV